MDEENLSIEAFIALLSEYGVTARSDVRSHPYSRDLPQCNKTKLCQPVALRK
ncbi:MAG: DUF488 family protein [Nostocaceae cyanobacterium]|nr:DUF488 family protein [Nostocaceae cyanobacterium]